MKSNFAALLGVAAAAIVSAAPAAPTFDPPFTIPQAQLDANIQCPLQPGGSYKGVTKPLLLSPGTGTTGPVSWDHTYVPLGSQLGYQPCYISPPPDMLGDFQDAVEYLVNAVHRLKQESGKNVPVMSWSAGGLITQWGLTFYPSIRKQVDRFVAFAPDFKGTVEAYTLTALQLIEPSIWQQTTTSHFITAMTNAGGQKAFVPTTSIYSSNDEVVEPEQVDPIASSYLQGASNFRVQDTCGPEFILEHSQELYNQATYVIAKAALASKTGSAPAGTLTAADCSEAPPAGLTPADVAYDLTLIPQAGDKILADPKVSCEPALRYYAKPYDTLPNTCLNVPGESQFAAALNGVTAPFGSLTELANFISGSPADQAKISKAVGQ